MKHKICKGKIYVIPMPIYGVLKHFVEDFKLQLGRQIAVYIHYSKKYLIVLCISRATNEKNAANAPCCKIK